MHCRRCRLAVLATAVLTLAASGCATSTPPAHDTVALQLHGAGGEGISLQVSSHFVREAVEAALDSPLECRATPNASLAALLSELQRQGPHGRATVRREHDLLQGSRHGRRLDLVITGEDGDRVEVRMPWAVGDCLLGNAPDLRAALARSGGRPVLDVRIAGEDGGRFRLALE